MVRIRKFLSISFVIIQVNIIHNHINECHRYMSDVPLKILILSFDDNVSLIFTFFF